MRSTIKFLRKGLLAAALVTPLLSTLPSNVSAQALKITTLSNPANLVSGGDALLRVDVPAHVPTNDVVIEGTGQNVIGAFPADQSGRTLADLGTNVQRGSDRRRTRGRPDQRLPILCRGAPIKPGYTINETTLRNNGWINIFEDDFTCTLDLNKWTYWSSGAYNDELQCYQLANLNVIDNELQIKATEESLKYCHPNPTSASEDPFLIKRFDYTSGRIESIQTFIQFDQSCLTDNPA
jgi:hypothetical protein